MSLTPEDQLAVLQRFVDSFPQDLLAVHAALAEASTPEPAKRFLIGGLNYALDMLDIFPDHHKGIGIADDALVLRVAARLARDAGATSPIVEKLATDSNLVIALFEDLAGPLEKLVSSFPDREVRGRTAAKILGHKDTHIMFDGDITREAKRHQPQSLGTGEAGKRNVIELRKMLESALKRAQVM